MIEPFAFGAPSGIGARLQEPTRSDPDYWAFATGTRFRGTGDLCEYPAMMVSEMQGALLHAAVAERGPLRSVPVVMDPFVGGGTVLTESMRIGAPFVGFDINPLAVLISLVRSEAGVALDLDAGVARVLGRARCARTRIDERGAWVSKWFRPDVAVELSRLRRAIRAEPDVRLRRALWVAVVEVVRTSGNMRIGRPKLQTRPFAELSRPIDIHARFDSAGRRVIEERDRHAGEMRTPGLLADDGRYLPGVAVRRVDVRYADWPAGVPAADVVQTSPPYGDNHTTMPYGQQSFLPLKWVDVADIEPEVDPELLASSKSLDTASLGGSRRLNLDRLAETAARSESLSRTLGSLAGRREPWQRVAAFFCDLDAAWARVLDMCSPEAHLIVTVGDRTVAGRPVPSGAIMLQLLESRGVRLCASLDRPIMKNRRLAPSNKYAASTIASERVLVMQRFVG